jgi:hypothetical protein
MNKLLIVLSLVVITCGCGDRQQPTGPTEPTTGPVSVSGRIVDFNAQTAVPGARVVFANYAQSGALTEAASAISDSSGAYVAQFAAPGSFLVLVDGSFAGSARITGGTYHGELFVNGGRCVARYGTIADARTLRPVAGAAVVVGGGRAVTDVDGWYRIDLGCTGSIGFNTAILTVTHTEYITAGRTVGRGISGVERLDVDLYRR